MFLLLAYFSKLTILLSPVLTNFPSRLSISFQLTASTHYALAFFALFLRLIALAFAFASALLEAPHAFRLRRRRVGFPLLSLSGPFAPPSLPESLPFEDCLRFLLEALVFPPCNLLDPLRLDRPSDSCPLSSAKLEFLPFHSLLKKCPTILIISHLYTNKIFFQTHKILCGKKCWGMICNKN